MRKPTSIIMLCLLLITGIGNTLYSATFTSAQSGYFSVGSTWVGGTAPALGDDIIIATGHTITLDQDAQVRNINIEAGAILVNSTFNVIGSSISPGASPQYINNGIHNGTGKFILYDNGGTQLRGSGVTSCNIEYRNYQLKITNQCNLTINGNIQPGIGGNATTILEAWEGGGGNLTINGDILTDPVRGGSIINQWGTIIVNGNVSLLGSSEAGAGSVFENGANATFNISGDLTLGPYESYCQNIGNMIIGGNLMGSGQGDTYFWQETGANVKFGGEVFPEPNSGLFFANSSALGGTSEPSTIEYNGTVAQTIASPIDGAYSNLIINNSSSTGVILNTDIPMNGDLTLSVGLFSLGNFNLILGETTSIGGTPSSTSMIVASGTGELRKTFASPGSFTFPVGDNDGTAEYSPVTIDFTTGTFTEAFVGVSLVNEAFSGVTGSHLSRYWNINSTGITDFTCNAQFDYVPADVTGTESNLYCYRVAPTVDQYNAANTLLNQLTASGLSSFGTFTGNQQPETERTLILSQVLLQGLYETGGMMRQAMGVNGPQFGNGIADEISIELHDPFDYNALVQAFSNVALSISGTAIINIPSELTGSYYITIKHRNSIETVSAEPVSFEGSVITYVFNSPEQVFGGNLFQMDDGIHVIFGSDVNTDGIIDTGDMTPVDNDASNYVSGYTSTDVNGDGIVDTADMTITDNNAAAYVSVIIP